MFFIKYILILFPFFCLFFHFFHFVGARKQLVDSFQWRDVKDRANRLLASGSYIHPKMKALHFLLTEHFERYARTNKPTRVIVFAQWRNSVVSIVKFLKDKESKKNGPPLIKPHRFVGQSNGTSNNNANNHASSSSSSSSSTAVPHDGCDVAPTAAKKISGSTGMNQALQESVVRGFTGEVFKN